MTSAFLSDKKLSQSHKLILRIVFALFFTLIISQLSGQTIELSTQKFSFTPAEFYIESIVDSRKDQTAVAYLFMPDSPKEISAFNLKNNLSTSLFRYLHNNLPQNRTLRPVIIRINSFNIRESISENHVVSGNLDIAFSFELKKEGELIKLIEYKGKAFYRRPLNNPEGVESALAKAVVQSLTYFNTWISREVKHNEIFANSVKFNFTDYSKNEDPDTLFYDVHRLMSWKDFKSKPENTSKYAATIFSFFAVESKNELFEGVITVNFNLKAYVVRNFSWVKDYARNAYTLNHEQRHFDIVKIISQRFKQKLLQEKITVDNFEGIISFEYFESLRELDRMQKKYDGETAHGTDLAIQKIWNERIENELMQFATDRKLKIIN